MPVRNAGRQALAPGSPSIAPGHVGGGPGLIDEYQPLGIEVELAFEPGLAVLQDVGAVLFLGVGGLFCA